MNNEKKQMQKLREQIDDIDAQLLALLNLRAQCAVEIAQVKKTEQGSSKDNNFSYYRPEREAQILRRIQDENLGPLNNETIVRLFREIMSACLALEETLPVGFLGPEGTFTHAASLKHFGNAVKVISLADINEVFKQTEAGTIAYGVVPIENSTEGIVSNTLDGFIQSPLKIVGEVEMRIHHNLISLSNNLSEVKTICSHQQSFSQCQQWLAKHLPDCKQIYTSSTAAAVLQAKESPSIAAIAGREAAERYEMPILQSSIEDSADNVTRFLVIGNRITLPSGHDKTSVLVSAHNRPGALVELLEPLARHQVSMTRIESRPAKSISWEYIFFIDIQGHYLDEPVHKALEELESKAQFFKLLGSYPASVL